MSYKHDNREEGIPFPGDYANNQEYYGALKFMVSQMPVPAGPIEESWETINAILESYEQGIVAIAPDTFGAERLLRPFMMVRMVINANLKKEQE